MCEFYMSCQSAAYFTFLKTCCERIAEGSAHGEAFTAAFNQWVADKTFKDRYIDEIFLQYPTIFGAGDITFQKECLGYMEDTLKKMLSEVNEENKQRGKLYVYLSGLAGIVIVILLV